MAELQTHRFQLFQATAIITYACENSGLAMRSTGVLRRYWLMALTPANHNSTWRQSHYWPTKSATAILPIRLSINAMD